MKHLEILPKHANLIDALADHIAESGIDASRFTIVFPGKRPGHFLLKTLAARIGKPFIPPRLLSISEFIENCFMSLHSMEGAQLNELDALVHLFEIHRAADVRIGKNYFDSIDAFLPLGYRIFAELEELRIEMVTEDQVDALARRYAMAETHYLAATYRALYAKLAERNEWTRSMMYAEVAQKIADVQFTQGDPIVFAGFFGLTRSERVILQHLRFSPDCTIVFQDGAGLDGVLEELTIPYESPSREHAERSIRFYSSSGTHGQVAGLNSVLAEIPETPDERTVIVLPSSESFFPIIKQTLPLLKDIKTNISLGYPIAQTPVYGFVTALMQLISAEVNGKFHGADYLNFVLHPYTKNIRLGQSSEATRILFHTIEKTFFGSAAHAVFSLDELEQNSEIFEFAHRSMGTDDQDSAPEHLKVHLAGIHKNTIGRFARVPNFHAFASALIELLEYISRAGTAGRHPYFEPFISELFAAIHGLQNSLLGSYALDTNQSYFSFFRQYLSGVEARFPGTPIEGLQVLGMLETRNISFDRVFLMNANDDVLPGGKGQDLLLSFELRKSLSIPTYVEREGISRYYFDVLTSNAKEVHLFFSADAGRDPSRFVEQLLWEEQQKAESYRKRESLISSIQLRMKLANPSPPSIEKTEDMITFLKSTPYSASALNTYLGCQLRFYYSRILRLKEKETVSSDVDTAEIGTFVHHVLQEYFLPTLGRQLTMDDVSTERMNELVGQEFVKEFGTEIYGEKFFILQQIRAQLESYLLNYQLPLLNASTIQITGLEEEFLIEFGGYNFKGFIDRVERRDGQIYILDYKTGSTASLKTCNFGKLEIGDRDTWEKGIGSLQLPLYTILYSQQHGVPPATVNSKYLWIGKSKIDTDIEIGSMKDDEDPAEHHATAEKVLFALLEEITNPALPFSPPADFSNACRNCTFRTLCGTEWAV